MEQNIVIVGCDVVLLEQFASKLATHIGYKYIDLVGGLDQVLLSSVDMPLDVGTPLAESREVALYCSFVKDKESITVMGLDMYLANENYHVFKDCFIIYVDNGKSDEKIVKIIKKHVDLTIKQENLKTNEIIKIIKG